MKDNFAFFKDKYIIDNDFINEKYYQYKFFLL